MPPATRRPLIVIGVLLAAAVVGTIVAGILIGPATYEPGTPEAAVQGFVQAVLDDDPEAALEWVDPTRGCRRSDVEVYRSDRVSARIDDVDIGGDAATVSVMFTQSGDDPFGGGWSYQETFDLARSGDGWSIERTTWFYVSCLR